ncbi:reverse transcriptase domain-containing protein [Flavobacterium psychrotrophum]|uniref:reverse transcriptase domain-containing protein n=1 Tax=Flavobacterium psychrotrophum TaxID=2294119 RepID=UPI000E3117A5|nr:reverse transcriptase domain-containing protein [Flavobacterium psychrotrophum]
MGKPPEWLKEKGYIHLSPSLQLRDDKSLIVKKIESPSFVAKYAFYPLLHTFISDRKYKKGNAEKHTTHIRRHTHYEIGSLKPVRNAKLRPLHYASHFDALVYGCYAEKLRVPYEKELAIDDELNKAIIAYRKIETFEGSGKGRANMHFAKECFDEIKTRSENEEIGVLAIDLKSFFSSLDHSYIKQQWAKLLGKDELPPDHYNVFRSCTKFRYVLRDDLRIGNKSKNGRKKPFDESKLASIRRNKGYRCFFETNEDFRNAIKEGLLPVYSNPFYREVDNKDKSKFETRKINIGIPQGLPISALLANIYLLEFDRKILEFVHYKLGGFYRRYSDDILIVCKAEQMSEIEKFTYDLIEEYKIKISKEKTERYVFKNVAHPKNKASQKLTCFSLDSLGNEKTAALSYLGFEFRGHNVGIKSSNLGKYYRKLISVVKRKAKRAIKSSEQNPNAKRAIFKSQVKKIYNLPLKYLDGDGTEDKKMKRKRYNLVLNDRGFYEFKHRPVNNKKQSNYHSYLKRCAATFETDSFEKQVYKSRAIVHKAMNKYLK